MKKVIVIVLLIAIFVIGGKFLFKKTEEQKRLEIIELCSKAYDCKIDKNDREKQYCKSKNDRGKEVNVECTSFSVCGKAYRCETDEQDYERVNCKIEQNTQVYDITCPNSFCGFAYGCINDETNSELLKCRYLDNKNEENYIKCPKNVNK